MTVSNASRILALAETAGARSPSWGPEEEEGRAWQDFDAAMLNEERRQAELDAREAEYAAARDERIVEGLRMQEEARLAEVEAARVEAIRQAAREAATADEEEASRAAAKVHRDWAIRRVINQAMRVPLDGPDDLEVFRRRMDRAFNTLAREAEDRKN